MYVADGHSHVLLLRLTGKARNANLPRLLGAMVPGGDCEDVRRSRAGMAWMREGAPGVFVIDGKINPNLDAVACRAFSVVGMSIGIAHSRATGLPSVKWTNPPPDDHHPSPLDCWTLLVFAAQEPA
jgi:hypothetical protein